VSKKVVVFTHFINLNLVLIIESSRLGRLTSNMVFEDIKRVFMSLRILKASNVQTIAAQLAAKTSNQEPTGKIMAPGGVTNARRRL